MPCHTSSTVLRAFLLKRSVSQTFFGASVELWETRRELGQQIALKLDHLRDVDLVEPGATRGLTDHVRQAVAHHRGMSVEQPVLVEQEGAPIFVDHFVAPETSLIERTAPSVE